MATITPPAPPPAIPLVDRIASASDRGLAYLATCRTALSADLLSAVDQEVERRAAAAENHAEVSGGPVTPAAIIGGYDWPTIAAGTPDHVRARADLAALNAAGLDAILRHPECHARLKMMAEAARSRLAAPRKTAATDRRIAQQNAQRAPLAAWREEIDA